MVYKKGMTRTLMTAGSGGTNVTSSNSIHQYKTTLPADRKGRELCVRKSRGKSVINHRFTQDPKLKEDNTVQSVHLQTKVTKKKSYKSSTVRCPHCFSQHRVKCVATKFKSDNKGSWSKRGKNN